MNKNKLFFKIRNILIQLIILILSTKCESTKCDFKKLIIKNTLDNPEFYKHFMDANLFTYTNKNNNFFVYIDPFDNETKKMIYKKENFIFSACYHLHKNNKNEVKIDSLSINNEIQGQKWGTLSFLFLMKNIFKNNDNINKISLINNSTVPNFYKKFHFNKIEGRAIEYLIERNYTKHEKIYDQKISNILKEKKIRL